MSNICFKANDEQSIGDTQELNDVLQNPITSSASCLDHEDTDERVKMILVEQVSSNWIRFAHIACVNAFYNIVEEVQKENNNNNQWKLETFLQRIKDINPLTFNEVIANCLFTFKRFDILLCVALDENYETVECILVEIASADWKRFAHYTSLHDINSIVKQIDCGCSDDQSKMAAFLRKLYELAPLNYKSLIVNSLNVASRFDVLFRLALVESPEVVMKLLLDRESSDWKSFAFCACLYEANCMIENIDKKNDSNQEKMKALLKKLFEINPLQFKELIKSTLITMKRFSVLSAFEEDGCLEKEKEEKEKVKEDTIEEPVLINEPPTSSNTLPPRHAALNDYSAADDDEVIVLKDQTKVGDILDNSELLLQLKMKIGEHWMNLGRFLLVSVSQLDIIDAENKDDLEEKAYRMLCLWKNQQKFPTLEALASAIYKINRLDLIKVLEKFSNKSFETENPLKPSIEDKANLLPKRVIFLSDEDNLKMFMKCFFEAQTSITEGMKRSIIEREWTININQGKNAHEVSHEKYFMEKFFDVRCELYELCVYKNILSEDEKKLVILCSTNVRSVYLYHPVKIDGWIPKDKIRTVVIAINGTLVSKSEFKEFFLPWIRLAEELNLELHDDTNFIDDICEWLLGSNLKRLMIEYRRKDFYNIEELKKSK